MDLKTFNIKAARSYKQKLKEFKTWAEVKSPKSIQPALSYTLGWLAPELLGTGFRMHEVSDFEMKAIVPAEKNNLDSQNELNQGLVLNASLELAKTFINRHLTTAFYQIKSSEITISKKQLWDANLHLHLESNEAALDDFFSNLQQNKKTVLQINIRVEIQGVKKFDLIDLKLMCEATHLLK